MVTTFQLCNSFLSDGEESSIFFRESHPNDKFFRRLEHSFHLEGAYLFLCLRNQNEAVVALASGVDFRCENSMRS